MSHLIRSQAGGQALAYRGMHAAFTLCTDRQRELHQPNGFFIQRTGMNQRVSKTFIVAGDVRIFLFKFRRELRVCDY